MQYDKKYYDFTEGKYKTLLAKLLIVFINLYTVLISFLYAASDPNNESSFDYIKRKRKRIIETFMVSKFYAISAAILNRMLKSLLNCSNRLKCSLNKLYLKMFS